MPAPSSNKIESAKRKYEQAKARYDALQARAATERRKLETRRKIILGALVLDAAATRQWPSSFEDLMTRISRDVDLKAFEGWTINGDRDNDE